MATARLVFGVGWMFGASWKPDWDVWVGLGCCVWSMTDSGRPYSARVMVTQLGALDSRSITATVHCRQGLLPSVSAPVKLKGSSTILGMSVMDVYSLY